MIKDEKATIQIITDATDPNTANTISNYINAILQNYQQDKNKGIVKEYQIIPQTRMVYNPELKSVFMFVPGVYDSYFNVGIGNDDFNFHHPGKRIGYHGSHFGIAH